MTTDEVTQWAKVGRIVVAILDSRLTNTLDVRATKINPTDRLSAYLHLDVTLTGDRYDQLREIVLGEGGRDVILLGRSDEKLWNVRVWP